jgi:hypothetical protein
VNCNDFIPNVTGQNAYLFNGRISIRLTAGGAPVAVKPRAVNRSTNVITSLYYYWGRTGGAADCSTMFPFMEEILGPIMS